MLTRVPGKERNRMTLRFLMIALALFLAGVVWSQRRRISPSAGQVVLLAKTDQERKVLAELDEVLTSGEVYLNVPATDGRMLRLLTEAVGARNVVEIGTSTGYSGLWLSLALLTTGGKLTTFEVDARRAAMAREHFKKAGVSPLITIVEGDAHANVSRLTEPIDVLFIDADKDGYVDYLNKLLPLVRPGGLILAHNVNMNRDFIWTVPDSASR
jgi:caffeoyl-CoA O-methyltransferase